MKNSVKAVLAAAAAVAVIPAAAASASVTTTKCSSFDYACAVVSATGNGGDHVNWAYGKLVVNTGQAPTGRPFTGRATIAFPGYWAGTATFTVPANEVVTKDTPRITVNGNVPASATVTVTLWQGKGTGTVFRRFTAPMSWFTDPSRPTR